jgi:hypothetical protein
MAKSCLKPYRQLRENGLVHEVIMETFIFLIVIEV